jgi:hypothetical protein
MSMSRSPHKSRERIVTLAPPHFCEAKPLPYWSVQFLGSRQTQVLPLKALQARILCTRHNSAFSRLDAMAGKLFRAVAEIYDDLGRRTLSRKTIWHLSASGDQVRQRSSAMPTPLRRKRTDRRRALELLAGSTDGCTEAIRVAFRSRFGV